MKISIAAGIAIVVALILIPAATFFGMKISAHNTANSLETQIVAAFDDSMSVMSNTNEAIGGLIGVSNLATDQTERLLVAANESRYGANGASALSLTIDEEFPNIDQSLHKQIMQAVEASSKDFQFTQTRLTDIKRLYREKLGSAITGSMMDAANYPKIAIGYPLGTDDDFPVIASKYARKTFDTGVSCGNAVTRATGDADC